MTRSLKLTIVGLTSLLAACAATEPTAPAIGRLRVTIAMSGLDLDFDGVMLTLDDDAPFHSDGSGTVTFDLVAGTHMVALGGLAANCHVDGDESRSAEVRGHEMADVAFSVTCGAATGVIEAAVVTSGADPDPDGYLVSIVSGVPLAPQRILGGTLARFAPVPGGIHAVRVSDVAGNCTVVGGNAVSGVQVRSGAPVRDTVRLAVAVTCVPDVGSVRVITSTSGPADPDGYVLSLPGNQPYVRLGANDTVIVPAVPAGTHDILFGDVAPTCAVIGSPPIGVTVTLGDTALVWYNVACQAPAVLRVSAPTSGPNPDSVYFVRVNGGSAGMLRADSTLTLDVPPGIHAVELTDIAANCTVQGPNPVVVSLTTIAATDLTFPVTCTTAASTGLDVTIVTVGTDPPTSYVMTLCQFEQWDCLGADFSAVVPANATFPVDLPAGVYYADLHTVPPNCRITSWVGTSTVTAGTRNALRIEITCYATVAFRASVRTTGADAQQQFSLTVDGRHVAWLVADSTATASALEGARAVGLAGVQENCRVTGANPGMVSFTPGVVTTVAFEVDCQAYPVLSVAVATSGTNAPAGYLVGLDPDWLFGGGYLYSTPVTPNGTVAMKLNLGAHAIWLDRIPGNCTVAGANPIAVDPALGTTTNVTFAVTCR